jgi:GT2 family glycosyltransferase
VPNANAETELPFATGCAMLIDLSVVRGPIFDASLFSYAEDLDLSLRVRESGRRIRYVPAALVHHFEGASHRKAGGQSLRFYLNTRNLLRVVARHARWYHWMTLAPMLATDVIGRFCFIALRDRDWRAFGAVLRGATDAVLGGRHAIERHGSH